jgi:hypothetical protein
MYTVITNIESVENTPVFVLLVFNNEGIQVDARFRKEKSQADSIIFMFEVMETHGQLQFKVLTSNQSLYAQLMNVPEVVCEIKHPDNTAETARFLKREEKVIREFYDIKRLPSKPPLPKWRKILFLFANKITEKLRGVDRYDIEI